MNIHYIIYYIRERLYRNSKSRRPLYRSTMYTKKGLVAPEEKQRRSENAEPREIGQWNWYIMAPSSYPRTCTHSHTHTHTGARAHTLVMCYCYL